jgi:hypothetical protein
MTSLLEISLSAAVPLRMAEVRSRGRDVWWRTLQERKEEWVLTIAEKGDILQYGGGKKGEVAEIFNQTAEAIAHLAFVEGGVRFVGMHFEGRFAGEATRGARKKRKALRRKTKLKKKARRENR